MNYITYYDFELNKEYTNEVRHNEKSWKWTGAQEIWFSVRTRDGAQSSGSETRSEGEQVDDEEYACIMKGLWIHHLDNEGVEQYQLCQWRNTLLLLSYTSQASRRLHFIRFIE